MLLPHNGKAFGAMKEINVWHVCNMEQETSSFVGSFHEQCERVKRNMMMEMGGEGWLSKWVGVLAG